MRLPDSDSALMLADSFLLNTEQDIDNIRRLGSQFNNVILPLEIAYFDQELEDLNFSFLDMNRTIANANSPIEGWRIYEKNYPMINRLFKSIQALPYSSASVERKFSEAGDIKTIKRNRLQVKSVEACLLCKQEFTGKDFCLNAEIKRTYEIATKHHRGVLNEDEIDKNPSQVLPIRQDSQIAMMVEEEEEKQPALENRRNLFLLNSEKRQALESLEPSRDFKKIRFLAPFEEDNTLIGLSKLQLGDSKNRKNPNDQRESLNREGRGEENEEEEILWKRK
jgi:hypothetical protein